MQFAENERLPQSSHASVAIGKRMDKFKFVVEHTRAYKQMVFASVQPFEQIPHQIRHSVGWWRHVNKPMLGVKNKMMVLLNWLWKYVSYNDSIRMITYATKPREVQERIKREQRTHLGEDLMD